MNQVRTGGASAGLRRCWRNWSDVVERFAMGHPSRHRFEPKQYETLHRELRAACQKQASDDPERGYYESLDVLVRPWLSLNALEQADRVILKSVLERCREVDRRMNGRDWLHSIRLWKQQAFLAVVVLGLVGVLAYTGAWRSIRDGVEFMAMLVTRTFSDLTLIQGIAVGGVVAALFGIWLVARTART